MYAPNSALLNALANHKINFKQVLKFIEARYDFEPTAFQNGEHKNAATENQGSCKIFCFAHLNNFSQLDTLALFAEHYEAVKNNPDSTDHQNIRQFMHHGWQGIHFEGHALTPKANIDEINAQAAQLYTNGGSEFEEVAAAETVTTEPVDAQPGAQPTPNPDSEQLVENTQNFAEPSEPKDETAAQPAATEQSEPVIPPAPGSSENLSTETTELNQAEIEPTAAEVTTTDTQSSEITTPEPIVEPSSPIAEDAVLTENPVTPADTQAPQVETATPVDHAADSTTSSANNAQISASELAQANTESIAENPAAFIEEENTTSDAQQAATTPETAFPDTTSDEQRAQAATPRTASDEQQSAPNTETVEAASPAAASTSSNASSANISAAELSQANAQQAADNPAAFIEDKGSTGDTADTATAPAINASELASASAAEIVASNANHIADNPAAYIEEDNSASAPDQPATTEADSAPKTESTEAAQNPGANEQSVVDGHGSANPAEDQTRDGELTEKVNKNP